jgi:NADH-quinone oxidoreductase subunit B
MARDAGAVDAGAVRDGGAGDRDGGTVRAAWPGGPVTIALDWGRRYTLRVFNVGLACCAVEFVAASVGRHDFVRLGVLPFAPGPRQADVMVVSGTVTDAMAPAITRAYDEMPDPKFVVSFGACANSGGPYWDSYSVTKGVDQLIPVDVYVPGCPPRPEALLHAIVELQRRLDSPGTHSLGAHGPDGGNPLAPRPDPRQEVAALTAPPVRRPGA